MGPRCGICGHLSQDSTSLSRHLCNSHGDGWNELTKYAEWLQTPTALLLYQTPDPPHVCAIFSRLALFVHHDLPVCWKRRCPGSGLEAGLAGALPFTAFAVPGAGRMAVQCCAPCGRSIGAHDMYLHLRHASQSPRDYTRGSLYHYMADRVVAPCATCIPLLQLAGLLCRLHSPEIS